MYSVAGADPPWVDNSPEMQAWMVELQDEHYEAIAAVVREKLPAKLTHILRMGGNADIHLKVRACEVVLRVRWEPKDLGLRFKTVNLADAKATATKLARLFNTEIDWARGRDS